MTRLAWWLCFGVLAGCSAQGLAGPLIADVYTDKARYAPGEAITITVELDNTLELFDGAIELEILNGVIPAHWATQSVTLAAGATSTLTFHWTAPPLDYRGFLVRVQAAGLDAATTAIDVSSHWTRFPRYGYLTQFFDGQLPAYSEWMIDTLARDYHIDGLQYYDWMYRHEDVVLEPRPGVMAATWVDWRDLTISANVLDTLITRGHQRGVAAMPYFMIYGARENYETFSNVQPEWGAYKDEQHTNQQVHPLDEGQGRYLFFFDPSNSHWQDHLAGEVVDAVSLLDFDGIHFDQIGDISPAYNWSEQEIAFADGAPFTSMLNRARSELDTVAGSNAPPLGQYDLVFNFVNGSVEGWGISDVLANAQSDFLYSEIWDSESYQSVHDFVRWARETSGDKALVLAAYMNYHDTLAKFDTPSVLLADAVFAVCGAHHLELGDGDAMLSHEFFPALHKTPPAELLAKLKRYYSHLTAYQNTLFDPALEWGDSGDQWILLSGVTASQQLGGDRVWVQRRRLPEYDVVHLVNLLGNDDQWRNPASEPNAISDLPVRYRIGAGFNVREVWAVSPDADDAAPQQLDFTLGSDADGPYVSFATPLLKYWTTVLIRRDGVSPAGGRYEAEDALKYGVAVDNDHPGYSGSGFVDQFGPNYEGVSFYVHIPVDGDYDLRFRYACGASSAASRRVLVDGEEVGFVAMPVTGGWDQWADAVLTVPLKAGLRHLVVGYGGAQSINFDYLEVPTPAGGLTGEYFDLVDFADRRAVRRDGPIDFSWGASMPATEIEDAPYLVRWSGQLTPYQAGPAALYVESEGGVRLFVAGGLLIDDYGDHALVEDSVPVTFTDTQPVEIVLLYRYQSGSARVCLSWESADQPKQAIDASYLAPATQPLDRYAPTSPEDFAVQNIGPDEVTLKWSAAIDDIALAGYQVLDNGDVVQRTSATSLALTGLQTGLLHTLSVQAVDVFGNVSVESEPVVIALRAEPVGDTDQDGDVDAVDSMNLFSCLAGPDVAVAEACWLTLDADADNDVDAADVATFQQNFTGSLNN